MTPEEARGLEYEIYMRHQTMKEKGDYTERQKKNDLNNIE